MQNQQCIKLSLRDAGKRIERYIDKKLSVMLWGPPGIGKSELIKQIAERNEMQLVDMRLAQMLSPDLLGLPAPNLAEGSFDYLPYKLLPQDGKGILFLDEFNQATREVQVASLQLLLDRRVGNYKLPDGWAIVAAGNREEDNALVNVISAPNRSRMGHIEVQHDRKIWEQDYASKNNVNDAIRDFLKFKEELFYKQIEGSHAFPTPRTWTRSSVLIDGLDLAKDEIEVEQLLSAEIGVATTKEFMTFCKIYRDTDVVGIAKGDKKALAKIKDFAKRNAGFKYATTLAISTYAGKNDISKLKLDEFGKLMTREFKMVFLTSLMDATEKGVEKVIELTEQSQLWGEYAEYVADEVVLA